MRTRSDLHVYQGDDWAGVVTVTDGAGAPAVLTGYTPKAQIRRRPADEDETIDVEMGAAIVDSTVVLSIPAATTEGMSNGYQWDLELVKDGVVTTILFGRVSVTAEVTRASA